MNFIKNTLKRCIKWAVSEDDSKCDCKGKEKLAEVNKAVTYYNSAKASTGNIGAQISDTSLGSNGMSFTVHNAVGGKVIQIGSYNIHTDRYNTNLYVITDKEDLGQELGQILTRESLSR
jgi:hypothetical protein